MQINVTVTAAAEKFMRHIVRFSGLPAGAGFRLVMDGSGCSGDAAAFSAEAVPQPGDQVLDVNGLAVFLPAESRMLLRGATIDFGDTPAASGLIFSRASRAAS